MRQYGSQQLAPPGSAAAPSWSFNGYAGTGTFATAGYLGLSCGGSLGAVITATGLGVANATSPRAPIEVGSGYGVLIAQGYAGFGVYYAGGWKNAAAGRGGGTISTEAASLVFSVGPAPASGADQAVNLGAVWSMTTTALSPYYDGAFDIGTPSLRVRNAYFGNNPTVSSDAALKALRAVAAGGSTPTTAEVAAWASVSGKIWSFKADATGLLHCGYIAQEVEAAFSAQGLDATRYGLLSKVQLPDGTTRYALVYAECAILEAAYQRGIAHTLQEQVALLQRQVAMLAGKLGVSLPTS